MSVSLTVTKPDGFSKVREFDNRRQAAKFGVFFYLSDNGYASKRDATAAASLYEDLGNVTAHGFRFQEGPA